MKEENNAQSILEHLHMTILSSSFNNISSVVSGFPHFPYFELANGFNEFLLNEITKSPS